MERDRRIVIDRTRTRLIVDMKHSIRILIKAQNGREFSLPFYGWYEYYKIYITDVMYITNEAHMPSNTLSFIITSVGSP